jgi:diaminopimelate epimerase
MRFAKGHGTENDFVIVFDPDGEFGLAPSLAARLCDRRAGLGADGVLRVVRAALAGTPAAAGTGAPPVVASTPPTAPPGGSAGQQAQPGGRLPEWFMDYRNADGSPAEMCGNGIRVFAAYLARHGLVTGPEFTVGTRSGPRRVRLEPDGQVTVEIGRVTVLGPGRARVGGLTCEGLRVSVGNPHLACLVERPLAKFDLSRPPELDPAEFPAGGNLELARVTGNREVAIRVYERGCGETRSCGTGAVAAAAAAAASGHGDGDWRVTVPGGTLAVRLTRGTAWLTGPAVIVAEGELDPGWVRAGGDRGAIIPVPG